MFSPVHKGVRLLIAALFVSAASPALPAEPHPLYQEWNKFELERSAPQRFDGPFRSDGLAFYLVHHGGPLRVEWRATASDWRTETSFGRTFRNAFFVRAYDREGELIDRFYHRFEKGEGNRVSGHIEYGDVPQGIYELRYVAAQNNTIDFDLQAEPTASFGILPLRNHLSATRQNQFREAYIYIPPGADRRVPAVMSWEEDVGDTGYYEVKIRQGTVALFDENGTLLFENSHLDPKRIPVREWGQVWRLDLDFPNRSPARFSQSGSFESILCPDPATARNIRGAVHISRDGKVFPHGFQVKMWDWIRSLEPEDLEVDVRIDPARDAERWMGEARNRYLWGSWGPFSWLPYLLENQTVDQPHDTTGPAFALGAVFSLDKPFNPFLGNPQLKNHLLLAEFSRYLLLRENESERPGWLQFVGTDAFRGSRHAIALAGAHFHQADPLYRLWLSGARRHVERYAFHRASVENQSTHVPVNLMNLSIGTRDPVYGTMARHYVDTLLDKELNPPLRTGYLMEGYGPDPGYQGISMMQLAWYYKLSGDQRSLMQMRKMYDLFNHTVVPQPDGSMVGAYNFGHRTPRSWANRQYRGGTFALAGELREAAVWHQDYDPNSDDAVEDANRYIQDQIQRYWEGHVRRPPGANPSSYRYARDYVYHPEQVLKAQWPVLTSDRFFRVFGDEFVAVRRPAYYALIYIGKPDPRVDRVRSDDPDQVHRRTGGGLSLLWTPRKGTIILSTNEQARENQMLLAQREDGSLVWPDYWNLEVDVDANTASVSVAVEISENTGRIERHYHFYDEKIGVSLIIPLDNLDKFVRFEENLPYFSDKRRGIEYTSIELLNFVTAPQGPVAYQMAIGNKSELKVTDWWINQRKLNINYTMEFK